jgi:hypothetical protein
MDIDAPLQILKKYNYDIFTMNGEKFIFDKDNYPKICDLIAFPSAKN